VRDLARILALPQRLAPPGGTERLSDLLGPLRPVQAQALAEMWACGGLVCPVGVGEGKTLITFLLPTILRSERPLLLVPAKLREKTRLDYARYSEQWAVTMPRVVSYEQLGQVKAATLLNETQPDLVMADEAHRLKNRGAACTRRMSRWMREHPTCPFVPLSGTLLSRSVRDCAHLFLWALRGRSPLPTTYAALEAWAAVTDCGEFETWEPGELSVFGSTVEEIRTNIRHRIVSTPGVVASLDDESCTASLRLTEWDHRIPDERRAEINRLRSTWTTATGEELVNAPELWAHIRDLTQGFYYRWDPPAPRQWLNARREWKRFVRETLHHSRRLDSEAHVAQAYPDAPQRTRWVAVRDSFRPNTVPVWMDYTTIQEAVEWAHTHNGIVWCDKQATGNALEAHGLPYYGAGGLRGGRPIDTAKGPLAASIAANSEGRNLQAWSEALVLSPPTTGARWEQMLGRLHRQGQMADEVRFTIHLAGGNNRESLEQAVADANYQEQILGKPQKLLKGDWER
jgi:hypothetical protein